MNTLDTIECICFVAEAVLAATCGLLSFRRAGKRKETSLFCFLLAGFYACVFMSDAFFLITWFVEDYPFVFSAGDISWVGGFFFLITATLSLMDKWTPEQHRAARKYRLPALAVPGVCVAFNVVYIAIYPEILVNYLLYAIPTVILSYLAFWLYLAGKKGGVQANMSVYHRAVMLWIAVQLFYDLFSTYSDYYPFAVSAAVSGWALTLAMVGVYIAAMKGDIE